MHPVIKIVSFLTFGAAVSMGNASMLVAGVSLVLPFYIFGSKIHVNNALIMLKRLKWLFVSILFVYLFFTPGQLLWPDVIWGPTYEGFMQGLFRISVLVLLVAAVNYLISSTERDDFLSAVLWCLQPLSYFGLAHERLAVRITLTLDEVSQLRANHLYDDCNTAQNKSVKDTKQESAMGRISRIASDLFISVIAAAESKPVRDISLPEESAPPLYQWFIPAMLMGLFAVIKYIDLSRYY